MVTIQFRYDDKQLKRGVQNWFLNRNIAAFEPEQHYGGVGAPNPGVTRIAKAALKALREELDQTFRAGADPVTNRKWPKTLKEKSQDVEYAGKTVSFRNPRGKKKLKFSALSVVGVSKKPLVGTGELKRKIKFKAEIRRSTATNTSVIDIRATIGVPYGIWNLRGSPGRYRKFASSNLFQSPPYQQHWQFGGKHFFAWATRQHPTPLPARRFLGLSKAGVVKIKNQFLKGKKIGI